MATCWMTSAFLLVLAVQIPPGTRAGIGYFWHVTDFHYDANMTGAGETGNCWSGQQHQQQQHKSGGKTNGGTGAVPDRFGNYRCDSTWSLVVSAVRAMKSITGEEIEFLLWTGDSAARWTTAPGEDGKHRVHEAVAAVTSLIRRHFPGTAVYPIVGGADVWPRGQTAFPSQQPYHDLANLWRVWLPPEAEATFKKGGYYVIEQARKQLHLVALNTNFYSEVNFATSENEDPDPGGQFAWLESILLKARRRRGTVYILGHIPPGIYERHYSRQALHWFQDRFNRKYLSLVQTYYDVIAGQFFGHAHTDSFRVVYDDYGRPISWILLAPAVSPREPGLAEGTGANNPAIRLVKFNTDDGQVLDYAQYYLNLTEANLNGRAEWRRSYNFTQLYGMPEVSAIALHNVANGLLTTPNLFANYYAVNHVLKDGMPFCGSLCRQVHFCSATQIDYADYDDCITKALVASSLSRAAEGNNKAALGSLLLSSGILFLIAKLLRI